jgi:hypothetical protein
MKSYPLAKAPVAVNGLVAPARKITLYGKGAAALSFRYAAEAACEEEQVLFLCGDNHFDPYAIARYAKSRRQRRDAVLNRILVARGFTGYQFDELIKRLDPEKVSGPVIISGVCSAFLDEDMSHNDAARLFYRAISRIIKLAQRGMALLLTQTQEIASARRAYFLRDLFRASDFIFRLDERGSFTMEMKGFLPRTSGAPLRALLN